MRQLHGRGFLADTEAPNRNWLQQYIHQDDQEWVTAVINSAIQTKSIFELEHPFIGSIGPALSNKDRFPCGRTDVPACNHLGKIRVSILKAPRLLFLLVMSVIEI